MDEDTKRRYFIGVIILSILLIVGVYKKLSELPDCHQAPAGKVVFLIDQTDSVNPLTSEEIKNRPVIFLGNFNHEHNPKDYPELDTPINSLVSLFNIESDYKNVIPVFKGCRPQKGSDTNAIENDQRAVDENYKKKFLDKILPFLFVDSRSDIASPILETLDAISRTSYFSYLGKDKPKTKVIIFSDLIQHTDQLSLYGCHTAKDAEKLLQKYSKSRLNAVKESYAQVDVVLNVIVRDRPKTGDFPTNECLRVFWESALGKPFEWAEM